VPSATALQQASFQTGRVLVSIRNAQEAALAVQADVDLVDIKEPSRGSLGAAAPAVIDAVIREVAGRKPLSVALGELIEQSDRADSIPSQGIRYAKVGLAGCAEITDWQARWRDLLLRMPRGVDPVAVVYADWRSASAPPPEQVLHHASQFGCRAVLVDTHNKHSGSLLAQWTVDEVVAFVSSVRNQGMLAVVAGSLCGAAIDTVVRLGPDYVAVRGAVCSGDRTAAVDAEKLEKLVRHVHAAQV
jgi:hypothetical protein